jgi:hypothetical protein
MVAREPADGVKSTPDVRVGLIADVQFSTSDDYPLGPGQIARGFNRGRSVLHQRRLSVGPRPDCMGAL